MWVTFVLGNSGRVRHPLSTYQSVNNTMVEILFLGAEICYQITRDFFDTHY